VVSAGETCIVSHAVRSNRCVETVLPESARAGKPAVIVIMQRLHQYDFVRRVD
jgi:hypothetical protein